MEEPTEIDKELKAAAEREFLAKEPDARNQLAALGLTPEQIDQQIKQMRSEVAQAIRQTFEKNLASLRKK